MYLVIDTHENHCIGIAHTMYELRETCDRIVDIEVRRMLEERYKVEYVAQDNKPIDMGAVAGVLGHGTI